MQVDDDVLVLLFIVTSENTACHEDLERVAEWPIVFDSSQNRVVLSSEAMRREGDRVPYDIRGPVSKDMAADIQLAAQINDDTAQLIRERWLARG